MIAISKEPADQLPSVISDNYQSGSERAYQLVLWWRYRAIYYLNIKSTFIKSESMENMKMTNSKLVNRLISKTKHIKNKLTAHNGHQEFKNDDDVMQTDSRISSKVVFIKSQLTPMYKPLSE